MSDAVSGFGYGDIPRRLLRNHFVWALAIISCLIELYDVALLPAFTSTQKARETTAVAENAVMRQAAEANLAEAKAVNETEVARNAERKQRAEARKAAATADKTKYEAQIAAATSDYADVQSQYEAKAQEAQATLVKQAEEIQNILNIYVERRKKAEADIAELETLTTRISQVYLRCGGPCRLPADLEREVTSKLNERSDPLPSEPSVNAPVEGGGTLHTYRVTSAFADGRLSLRDGRGKSHTKLGEMSAGTTVHQIGPCLPADDGTSQYDWCNVEWGNTTGWASTMGLEVVKGGNVTEPPHI